jgi:exopolyphosphatase/guanosine-5'-triphosphate,3'-diphosphate pyrophosphatase
MFVADGKVLYKALNTTRLGEGLASSCFLKKEAIDRSANAVKEFYFKAKEEGAEKVFAFATAAARSAQNGKEFVEKVSSLCPVTVEILSGEEEGEIGVLGALGNGDGGIIDVGGASAEIAIKEKGELIYKKSVDVGVVRLKDKCGTDKKALIAYSQEKIKEYGVLPVYSKMYAIGGTATTLAALHLSLTEYDSSKITGTVITVDEVTLLADKLLSMPIEEIALLPCMPKGRADVIGGGALYISELMKGLQIKEIIVSDKDNLEGYAIKRGLME